MKILVNDEPHAISPGATLGEVLAALGQAGRKGVAVAVNDSVVARSSWPDCRLADGDRVLLIQATQGG